MTLALLVSLLGRLVFSASLTGLALMPNPFSPNGDGFRDTLHVKFQTQEVGDLVVRVFDISGREVRSLFQGQVASANQSWDISWDGNDDDGRNLSSGVYIVLVDFAGSKQISKAILRR